MTHKWEEERDKFRRTVNYVVDGAVEGYYYEDSSDPGVFVVYAHNPSTGNFVNLGPKETEEKARNQLRYLLGPYKGELEEGR